MSRIDLDEIAGELEQHEIVIGGVVYQAPVDLSVPQLLALQDVASTTINLQDRPDEALDALRRLFTILFGAEQGGQLVERCTLPQLAVLIAALSELYLEQMGKEQGSSRASRRAGTRSKPTSGSSTRGSTSARRASVPKKRASAPRKSRG